MAKARSQHTDAPQHTPASFRAQLELALAHFGEPVWLGEHSPLAAPYVIGAGPLERSTSTPAERAHAQGMALRRRLLATAQTLHPNPDQRYNPARLLELTYFKPNAQRTQAGIATDLEISPATYYRQRAEAIAQLETAFVAGMRASDQADLPVSSHALIGRTREYEFGVRAVQNRKVLALTGQSGSGKTSLGAQVCAAHKGPVFWYTFRTGINDRLAALVFALARFLHNLDQAALWMQLTAGQNKIEADLALSLTRAAFERLKTPVLLVFDEADLIAPRGMERDDEAHQAVRGFLEALAATPRNAGHKLPAMLFIGQQLLVEPDVHFILEGLSPSEAQALLSGAGVVLAHAADYERLYAFTNGNPLLLTLFVALQRSGEPLTDTLRGMSTAPSLQLLLNRIGRRLNALERLTLATLAVFDGTAPADAWRDELGDALRALVTRGLVRADSNGGVALQPALREAIARQSGAEQRARSHLFAAQARAERGEYTAAARHYVNAGEPALAVLLWSTRREQEIARGNATAALDVFERINRDTLDETEQRTLALLRSQLRELAGDGISALNDLESLDWRNDDAHTPEAKMLAGNFQSLLGNTDQALAHFRAGLRATEQQMSSLSMQRAQLHTRSGYAHISARALEHARNDALSARFEGENLQGEVEVEHGNYAAARAHFDSAMSLARLLASESRIARVRFAMGTLAARGEDLPSALSELTQARAIFENLGDLVQVHRCNANLGFCHMQAGNPHDALEPAQRSLQFFESIQRPYYIALNAGNLAEAQLRLGDLAQAEQYALQSMRQEDPGALAYGMVIIAEIRLRQRRLRDAEQAAADAITLGIDAEDAWVEASAQRVLAQICAAAGESDRARIAFDRAVAIYTELNLPREVERTRALI